MQRPKQGRAIGQIPYVSPILRRELLENKLREMKEGAGFKMNHSKSTLASNAPINPQKKSLLSWLKSMVHA